MKNVITYLKTLWSRVAGSQRNDVEVDRRLTVGSPSGFTINWTLKLVSVLVLVLTIGIGNAWGADFSTTYNYAGQGTSWSITNAEDADSYYKSSSSSDCVVTVLGIFTGKTITSDVVITLDVACYGNGSNPTSSKFSIYNSSACTSSVTATQGGTLPTNSTYRNTTYTITKANAVASFTNDLAIKIASGTKLIRFRSFTVAFTYTTGAVSYTVYLANNCSDGNSYSITGAGSSTGTYGGWANTYSVSANTEITLGYTAGAGQTFGGWEDAVYDGSSNPITVTNNKLTVTKDVYVYCNFSASCVNGTISYATGSTTYTGGNAISGSHANSTKVCSTNLTLPGVVFTTTGYTQDGWATSDGGSKAYNLSATNYATEGDATLYPHWTANKYTVSWSVNGSVTSTTPNVSYNTTTSTPANPSVPGECTGSTFMGWTTTQNYTGDSAPGDLFNGTTPAITGNVTFYAVFADEN